MNVSKSTSLNTNAPQLDYYGGRILEHPKFVSLYIGAYWDTAKGKRERAELTSCSKSIPSGDYASVWKEYGTQPGTYVGGANLPLAKGAKMISQRDVKNMVSQGISASAIKPDGETVYTVFLPPGTVLVDGSANSKQGLGGFHGSYLDPQSRKPVYYSAIVYADKGNGVNFTSDPVDNISIAASHEWSEVVTDPDVNRAKLGWYDETFGEIGDIPITMGYRPATMWGRINGCAVQKEWSNVEGKPVIKE